MPPFTFQPYEHRNADSIAALMQAPARAKADALRTAAQLAAQSAQIQAQAKANLFSTLGNSVSQSIGAVLQERREAPLRAAQLANLESQTRARNQQTQANDVQIGQQAITSTSVGAGLNDPARRAAILDQAPPNLRPVIAAQWAESDKASQEARAAKEKIDLEYVGRKAKIVKGFLKLGLEPALQAFQREVESAVADGHPDAAQYWDYIQQNPQALPQVIDAMLDAAGMGETPIKMGPGEVLGKPSELVGQPPIPPLPPRQTVPNVGSFEDYVGRTYGPNPTPDQILKARKDFGQADDRAVTVNVPGGSADDPKAIADAIIAGDQPPSLQGLYRLGAPVRAELARRGYNLTDAMTDWNAVQRHTATLNGPQQTRLRQAAETAYHSLDIIDDLANQWNGGNFPLLNKGRLKAAKEGALGPKAQTIATALEAQISDLTSELGNVYMGGNSPTDHSLSLAAKNLSADWSEATLKSMVTLARKNLEIRLNSIKSTPALGVSAVNPYGPPTATVPPSGGTPERRPIPGIPGGEAELRDGKWIRVK